MPFLSDLSFSVPFQDISVSTLAFPLYLHTFVLGIWLGTGNHVALVLVCIQ